MFLSLLIFKKQHVRCLIILDMMFRKLKYILKYKTNNLTIHANKNPRISKFRDDHLTIKNPEVLRIRK